MPRYIGDAPQPSGGDCVYPGQEYAFRCNPEAAWALSVAKSSGVNIKHITVNTLINFLIILSL